MFFFVQNLYLDVEKKNLSKLCYRHKYLMIHYSDIINKSMEKNNIFRF